MSFSGKKREFDRCFNRPDRPVNESRPNRSTWPVSISGTAWRSAESTFRLMSMLSNVLVFFLQILPQWSISILTNNYDILQSLFAPKYEETRHSDTRFKLQMQKKCMQRCKIPANLSQQSQQ